MTQQLDVAKLIDDARLGRLQLLTFGLCFVAMLIDGFDMLILPNTAPLVLHALHIEPARFGMLISISLVGMLLSGFGGGLLADKLGRRILILSGMDAFWLLDHCQGVRRHLRHAPRAAGTHGHRHRRRIHQCPRVVS